MTTGAHRGRRASELRRVLDGSAGEAVRLLSAGGVELPAGLREELGSGGLGVETGPVGARLDHRAEGVDHRDDAGAERDFLAAQAAPGDDRRGVHDGWSTGSPPFGGCLAFSFLRARAGSGDRPGYTSVLGGRVCGASRPGRGTVFETALGSAAAAA